MLTGFATLRYSIQAYRLFMHNLNHLIKWENEGGMNEWTHMRIPKKQIQFDLLLKLF